MPVSKPVTRLQIHKAMPTLPATTKAAGTLQAVTQMHGTTNPNYVHAMKKVLFLSTRSLVQFYKKKHSGVADRPEC